MLAQIDAAFANVTHPVHFTNAQQKDCEASYHDETLLTRPCERLRREDLDQASYNPLRFTHAAAEAYLLPVLARYALMPYIGSRDIYVELLIWHLDASAPTIACWFGTPLPNAKPYWPYWNTSRPSGCS